MGAGGGEVDGEEGEEGEVGGAVSPDPSVGAGGNGETGGCASCADTDIANNPTSTSLAPKPEIRNKSTTSR